MKIVFMGSSAFAVPSLDILHNAKHDIVRVITQPDKPAGRGRRLQSPPVANEARQLGLPIYQPKSVKSEKVVEKIRNLAPELIVIAAYGKILPRALLDVPKMGCINVHASLLPKYRGAAPINWAVVNGEKETGVTTMLINEEMDAGDILLSRSLDIDGGDNSITLHDKLAPMGAELLIETIKGLRNSSIKPVPQDHSKATFAPILKKEDGLIDWAKDAESIRNLVRGMQPWPSAYTYFDQKMLKILNVDLADGPATDDPGTVHVARGLIEIDTGRGRIILRELQIEGKRRMSVRDFLNGHDIPDKTTLE